MSARPDATLWVLLLELPSGGKTDKGRVHAAWSFQTRLRHVPMCSEELTGDGCQLTHYNTTNATPTPEIQQLWGPALIYS